MWPAEAKSRIIYRGATRRQTTLQDVLNEAVDAVVNNMISNMYDEIDGHIDCVSMFSNRRIIGTSMAHICLRVTRCMVSA